MSSHHMPHFIVNVPENGWPNNWLRNVYRKYSNGIILEILNNFVRVCFFWKIRLHSRIWWAVSFELFCRSITATNDKNEATSLQYIFGIFCFLEGILRIAANSVEYRKSWLLCESTQIITVFKMCKIGFVQFPSLGVFSPIRQTVSPSARL